MVLAAIPLLAILLGLANHARGRGTLIGGRWMCAACGGIGIGLVAALIGFEPLRAAGIAVSNTFGLYNWLMWGWGLYFAAFTGQWSHEKEIGWIDYICLRLVPFVTSDKHWTNYVRGWLGMTLRGLYLIPMFMLFDPLGGKVIDPVWWIGIVGLLQGSVYSVNRLGNLARLGTAWPELLMGALIGAASGCALVYLSILYKIGCSHGYDFYSL